MNQNCPIEYNSINAHLVRVYAGFILVILLTMFIFNLKWLAWVLLIDFFLRMSFGVRYGLFCHLSSYILRLLKIKEKPVNALPKKFAVKIGFLFSVLLILSLFFENNWIFNLVSIIFIIAVALEVFFNFCLACKMYQIFITQKNPNSTKEKGIFN